MEIAEAFELRGSIMTGLVIGGMGISIGGIWMGSWLWGIVAEWAQDNWMWRNG